MSSENSLTGRGGHISVDGTEVARVTQWEVNPTLATSSEWGDSGALGTGSNGFTNRSAGRKDCTFTTEGKFETTQSVYTLFAPEDIAAVILYLDSGISPLEPVYHYDFDRALCTDFSLSVNIDTEEIIGWTASWGTDGAYTLPAV